MTRLNPKMSAENPKNTLVVSLRIEENGRIKMMTEGEEVMMM